MPLRSFAGGMAAAALLVSALTTVDANAAPAKGVNYVTGEGMDRLNCEGANTAQIAKDMAQLKAIGAQWVRIETSMTALTALPDPPSCPLPIHEFDGLINLLQGIESIGAQPIVNILEWHYPAEIAKDYKAWLSRLLAAAPGIAVFELGDEENLSYRVESYPGANPDLEPYGWDFNPHDFKGDDPVGVCPKDEAKLSDIDKAVKSYVTWLADSASTIRAARPSATIMLGGLSSYQPDRWLKKLGDAGAFNHADVIGYHPYARYVETPQDSAATLDDLVTAMASWKKELPIWITEYGFSSNKAENGAVKSEQIKAEYMATEFGLLAPKVQGPIVYYTARDYPLTAPQWKQQCSPHDCPAGVGGAGLFEWRNSHLIVEPAASAFATLGQ